MRKMVQNITFVSNVSFVSSSWDWRLWDVTIELDTAWNWHHDLNTVLSCVISVISINTKNLYLIVSLFSHALNISGRAIKSLWYRDVYKRKWDISLEEPSRKLGEVDFDLLHASSKSAWTSKHNKWSKAWGKNPSNTKWQH